MDNVSQPVEHKHESFVKSNLFVFLLGQFFALIAAIIVVAVAWGAFSERYLNLVGRVANNETRITNMDEKGTNYSRRQLDVEEKVQQYYDERLKIVEKQLERIGAMDMKLNRLEDKVDGLKAQNNK